MPGCDNDEEGCLQWAADGECEKNKAYMMQHCKLSCGICDLEQELSKYTGQEVQLVTGQGSIRIRPRWDTAPIISGLVLRQAHLGQCRGCRFYRNEARPQEGFGPPYALLQGSLSALPQEPPFEGAVPVRAGMVCIIPGSREFFIAIGDHPEWNSAHPVWGDVVDGWAAIHSLVDSPYRNITHEKFGTRMRMMLREVPFELRPITGTT